MTTPTKVLINGMDCTLFREGPPAVYLRPDGRFTAEYGGAWITRTSIASLDKKLKAGAKTLKIMRFSDSRLHDPSEIDTVEAQDFLNAKIIDGQGKRVWRGYGTWAVFDQTAYDALIALEKERAAFLKDWHKRHEAVTKKLTRVYKDNFKRLLNGTAEEDE